MAEFVRIEAQPRDQFAIKLWLDRPHSDPLSVGAAIAVVEMRAAVEAIRLASVLPSPAGPVTVEHRHEPGRSIAYPASDPLPRPRDPGSAMGAHPPHRPGHP